MGNMENKKYVARTVLELDGKTKAVGDIVLPEELAPGRELRLLRSGAIASYSANRGNTKNADGNAVQLSTGAQNGSNQAANDETKANPLAEDQAAKTARKPRKKTAQK